MGRLGDADWWWEYALDGVVGGVIGGLVTALAVWLTLRHERTLLDRSIGSQAALSELATARSAATATVSAAVRLALDVHDPKSESAQKAFELVFDAATTLNLALAARWPQAASLVDEEINELFFLSRGRLRDATQLDPASITSTVRNRLLTLERDFIIRWLMNPEVFEKPVTTPPGHRRGRRS